MSLVEDNISWRILKIWLPRTDLIKRRNNLISPYRFPVWVPTVISIMTIYPAVSAIRTNIYPNHGTRTTLPRPLSQTNWTLPPCPPPRSPWLPPWRSNFCLLQEATKAGFSLPTEGEGGQGNVTWSKREQTLLSEESPPSPARTWLRTVWRLGWSPDDKLETIKLFPLLFNTFTLFVRGWYWFTSSSSLWRHYNTLPNSHTTHEPKKHVFMEESRLKRVSANWGLHTIPQPREH